MNSTFVSIKPIYEFLVWDNCSNDCKFCFQRRHPRLLSELQQRLALQSTVIFLNSQRYEDGSHVLIVGGELFDDNRRFQCFHNVFSKLSKMMVLKKIDQLYINTNLLYSSQNVNEVLSLLGIFKHDGVLHNIHFTTSYDIYGRYATSQSEKLFLQNLDTVSCVIQPIVNIILTRQFCELYMLGEFSISSFCKMHNVKVNLIPYIVLSSELSPSRQLLFKTISKIRSDDYDIFISFIHEHDLKQPRKMFYYENQQFMPCECSLNSCGHSVNFTRYSDNGTCFVCDVKRLFCI